MTPDELARIRARADAAYAGGWWVHLSLDLMSRTPDSWTVHADDRFVCDLNIDTPEAGATAEFIAAAREDVPALLDEVERLRGLLAEDLGGGDESDE